MLDDEALQTFALELYGTKMALFKRLVFFVSCMIEGVDTDIWSWFQQLSTECRIRIKQLGIALARKHAEVEDLHMYVHELRWQTSTFLVLNGIFESVFDRDVFDVIWFHLMEMSKTNKVEFCKWMSGHSKKLNRVRTQCARQKWLTIVRHRVLLPRTLYCLDV